LIPGATGRDHLTDDSRQQSRRVLPADQVEALEGLVDEVERVPSVGERPPLAAAISASASSAGEKPAAIAVSRVRGRLAVAHGCPTPQPALERGRIRPAAKR
jgi:hypothetical protein